MRIKNLIKCTVPKTNKEHYLTSITALNIPSDEGTGDWHFYDAFYETADFVPKKYVAGIDTLSTNEILGDNGVYDAYSVLVETGLQPITDNVYAADHYRAVADMVFDLVRKVSTQRELNMLIILDDWLTEPEEKERLFSLTDQFRGVLTKKEYQRLESWKTSNWKG
ncbi:hypothetical protein [sulfur-oxidizing endosymbiont of Gigantopelta aegis]|uniref:hypothetical protein n=1 Tax=sulfur-oxidizing endosymbiont of Gigantopelta aegis TaxID=2794934 RepID=UPI0018DB7E10|nr:hypothetical protein [sulfur-oxidizing endosymbiont of Gigantopelta aegis]